MRFSSARHIRIQVAFARHLDAEQLLDREHEDELVRLEGDVVDPLGAYVIAFHHVFCSMFFSKPVWR